MDYHGQAQLQFWRQRINGYHISSQSFSNHLLIPNPYYTLKTYF